jgi:hypothetical protein
VPPEALSLALAASIYPPAVAIVIALGRGADVRLRVFLFVIAALATVFVTGALMLFLFVELGATGQHHRTPSAALSVAIGVALLGVAAWLYRKGPGASQTDPLEQRRGDPSREGGPPSRNGRSRTERYMENRRLVLLLGVIVYVLPSPIYVGAVKAIADATHSTTQELAYLAVIVVLMLWMVEVPMLMLLAFPRRSVSLLERVNAWFHRHGRLLAVVAAAGAGVYLIVAGLVGLA